MVSNFCFYSGSPLCGSPIILQATAATLKDSSLVSFRHLVMKIYAVRINPSENSDSEEYSEFSFLTSVTDEETVRMDISSALKSVMETWERKYDSLSVPYVKYHAEAYEEWMIKGKVITSESAQLKRDSSSSEMEFFYAYMGRFTQMERLEAWEKRTEDSLFMEIQSLSTKPASGEMVPVGESIIQPVPYASPIGLEEEEPHTPSSVSYSFNTTGMQSISGAVAGGKDRKIYVIENDRHAYGFRFFNRRGCLESVTAYGLPEEKAVMSNEKYIQTAFEEFYTFPRTIVRKTPAQREIQMSSGPLDKDWQNWWIGEFLVAEYVWMLHDGIWIPCAIVPEDDTTVKDYAKTEVREVNFTTLIYLN